MNERVLADALEEVANRRDLSTATARAVMDRMMEGSATPAQMGAILAALRTKGETIDELVGMVESMRDHAVPVTLSVAAVDTCGTGGDRSGTFNISTAAALVAAGAGCRVAKHGNRAASSRCGSADVLEALGVAISLPAAAVSRCVAEVGIGFLFAPSFHPAMRHAGAVRRELGVRTVFNVLGPLANPARVRHQALGVADPAMLPRMAQVLQRLGHRHALVFNGADGLDELSLSGPAHCHEVLPDRIDEIEIDPAALGLTAAPATELAGGDAGENAALVRQVLAGEDGPRRDVVVLNAAAALVAADAAADMQEGVERARAAIDSGAAARVLDELVRVSTALEPAPR